MELLWHLMRGTMSMELLQLLIALTLSGVFDGMDTRFQYTSDFLCNIVDWFL